MPLPAQRTLAIAVPVRLLLDAHLSGPRVGRRLEAEGHDVRALD